MCDKCGHSAHVGVCGEDMVKQSVTVACICLVATPKSLDAHELRTRDVIQQADIREAQQRDWDALSPQQQQRIRRRVPYRRMKL